MSEMILMSGYGGTMDMLDVTYDTGKLRGNFFLTPTHSRTQNGALAVKGKETLRYCVGGEKLQFELRAETEDGVKIVKSAYTPLPPKIEYTRKDREIKFQIYNTLHFYLNNGIGRIDATGGVTVLSGNNGFSFTSVYNVPPRADRGYDSLKAICLPVVLNGKASPPYCIVIPLSEVD